MDARIAVLASGAGTNLQALLDDPIVRPWVVLVLTDRPGVPALDRAAAAGVATEVVDFNSFPDRTAFAEGVRAALDDHGVDHIVLAGFMRIMPPAFIGRYEGRILNTHPALLPAFPGAHPVRDTLAWGAKVSGVTVHFVDEEVDHGPIVAQEAVPVHSSDDEESLHARLKAVEHRLLPRAVRLLVEGRLKLDGRMVHVVGEDVDG